MVVTTLVMVTLATDAITLVDVPPLLASQADAFAPARCSLLGGGHSLRPVTRQPRSSRTANPCGHIDTGRNVDRLICLMLLLLPAAA